MTAKSIDYFANNFAQFNEYFQKINIRRISIFKIPADNLFLRSFWDEKSRDANGF